ncbi:hypothetical protein HYALB_00006468 [Hymenoscyphus albidus]|uniref:EF-hand domain-containing protein n=1 Tax=Hymenoscyphus albidus TaxID=595503 RepID=A0A9N9Q3J2_9HELO|nr:hypothetical protein HYALB_00006468 [Hymenoscyphus albidus]
MSANKRLSKDATALRGAALAFGKPPVKPKPKTNTYSGNNGALAAATKAGAGGSNQTPSNKPSDKPSVSKFESAIVNEQRPGCMGLDGSPSREYAKQAERSPSIHRIQQSEPGGNGLLRVDQAKSASYIAANLAASRSPTASPGLSPNVTGNQSRSPMNSAREMGTTQRSPSPLKSSSSSRSSDQPLDTSSIPPTTSLINMFEKSKMRPISLPAPKKPVVTAAQIDDSSPNRQQTRVPARARTPSPRAKPKKPELKPRVRTPPPTTKTQKPDMKPKPPLPVEEARSTSTPEKHSKAKSPSVAPAKGTSVPSSPLPVPEIKKVEEEEEEASSDDSFVSASDYNVSDYKPSFRAELQTQQRRLNSSSGASTKSSVTVDSLANAIVASSLASSRAASPAISLPPVPPPARRGARSHLFHSSTNPSRSASPQKVDKKPTGLRTTMRKPPKPDEEIDEGAKRRTKKAHIMKKHPNKHHEGDRKRWRDELTERERKRYEAVWASNKNLYMSPSTPAAETSVCNLVVRDIWSRSRLHVAELEEAYQLVDGSGNGCLNKEEFVVGLWLVDQRLKGRKLPIRVSNSVWHSAGAMAGSRAKTVKQYGR